MTSTGIKRTLALMLIGIALIAFGLKESALPLRLLITGHSGFAEAVRVVKEHPGLPPKELSDDAMIQAEETTDRSCVFWNEFVLLTSDGREVSVRLPVGSQIKPLYPLRGPDGLPTALFVRYDPLTPDRVTFPTVLGVWFIPGAILFAGLIAFGAAAVLIIGRRLPE